MTEIIFTFFDNVNNFINIYYFYSLCFYFLVLFCYFTLSLPGGVILLIGSGFFFGFIAGFIINIFAISFGSLVFIIFSKTLFSKLFAKNYHKFSDKLSIYIKNSSFEYLILIRLIIGPPIVFQNICISLLKISKIKVFSTSMIGFTPLMLLFSYIGSYASSIVEFKSYNFSNIFSSEILFIFCLFIILISLRIYFKK
tara:strand:+ start:184 stop:774 length:591 start_codon:yes stop_codon:yes gene_type:complete